jgi:O-antigen biosynthesis protein
MNRSYLVYAPPFNESSGGIKAMHRLAVELQKRGQEVFINTDKQNPHWPKIPTFGKGLPVITVSDAIAIYPEIVSGNPFDTRTVVRYLLNVPGACSPDYRSTWDTDDILFTYSRLFNTKLKLPDNRVMLIPHIDLEVFYDRKLKSPERLVYRGKGQQKEDERLKQFSPLGGKEDFRGDDGQKRLADSLNRCELLYCYDNATAMTEIARLCGCPVVLIPDGSYSEADYHKHEFWNCGGLGYGVLESSYSRMSQSSSRVKEFYETAEKMFQERLTDFINLTQTGNMLVEKK